MWCGESGTLWNACGRGHDMSENNIQKSALTATLFTAGSFPSLLICPALQAG